MKRTFGCCDFVDFLILIIEDIQAVLSVIGFACWVVVSLQLHQELVGSGTELELDLLGLFYGLLVKGLVGLIGKELDLARVVLLVQV